MVYPHVMLKRYICSTIIFAVLAIPSSILIYYLFAGPGPESLLTTICESLVALEYLTTFGLTFVNIAYELFIFLAWLNVYLLAVTYVYLIILDTINISLHWLIKSAIFVGLIILINLFFLNSTAFAGAQFIGTSGAVILNLYSLIHYLTMFLIILVVKNWLCKKHV